MTETTSVEADLTPSVFEEGVRSVSVHETGVTTSDASARVQRVPFPVASPGACVLCGKYEHPDGFAFFGLDFEFFGTLYFCADCAGDIAAAFNWVHPDRSVALQVERDSALKANQELVERVQILEQSVESLTRYSTLSNGNPESSDLVAMEPLSNAADEGPKLTVVASPSDSVDEQSSDESDVSEPADEQRPDDVPEPTSSQSAGSYLDVISELGLE